jgi:hypothetical protein
VSPREGQLITRWNFNRLLEPTTSTCHQTKLWNSIKPVHFAMRSFIGFIGSLLVFVNFGLSNTLSYEFNVRDAGNATFDYVIVGSGTAGLTIAARLADQNFRMAEGTTSSCIQLRESRDLAISERVQMCTLLS